jgi:superoxide dismutase, Cu-Zn family
MSGGLLRVRVLALAAIALASAAGCRSTGGLLDRDELPSPASAAYGAVFVARNGSAASGNVRIVPRDDGIVLTVYAAGLAPGRLRVAIHENGNCSSPNAFSAGRVWSPPGVTFTPPSLTASAEGNVFHTVRLPGIRLEGPAGLMGKSVVLHEDNGTLDAQPGVPNGRVACGVIGPMRQLF